MICFEFVVVKFTVCAFKNITVTLGSCVISCTFVALGLIFAILATVAESGAFGTWIFVYYVKYSAILKPYK